MVLARGRSSSSSSHVVRVATVVTVAAAATTAVSVFLWNFHQKRKRRTQQQQQQQQQHTRDNHTNENSETTKKDEQKGPVNHVSYRDQGGPSLTYLWCSSQDQIKGQSLYLGGEEAFDQRIFCIPGHAERVLVIDTHTDEVYPIGPPLPGKFKWLRGILNEDKSIIYGLPCHADSVLKINARTNEVTTIPIPYEEFYQNDPSVAQQQRTQTWKYHGGTTLPKDGCLYAIPQAAWHVLKIDPKTDTCTFVGPPLKGRCKWYGGTVGKQDQAIYGIPQNASSVLRIDQGGQVTTHGDFGQGGHKWHGGGAAENGTIVCVPANADSVLCITPGSPEPTLELVGNDQTIQTGRHRSDKKYKFLGAMTGTDGKVYCFPSGSEQALQVDTTTTPPQAKAIGPNLYDQKMERMLQNKWQNGLTSVEEQCVYAIPLAADTVLRIDTRSSSSDDDDKDKEPVVTTWKLPFPQKGLAKWEGGVMASNGVMYCMPNNHKAVLRITPSHMEPKPVKGTNNNNNLPSSPRKTKISYVRSNGTKKSSSHNRRQGKRNQNSQQNNKNSNTTPKLDNMTARLRGDTADSHKFPEELLKYKTGIATLRGAAHRVSFSLKHRKHDPKPTRHGSETKTTWLPSAIRNDNTMQFDTSTYDFHKVVVDLLDKCDSNIVGQFKDQGSSNSNNGNSQVRLEDFEVPPKSLTRSCQGGCVEDAQKYLSDAVASNTAFSDLFDRFVVEVMLPHLKDRLIKVGALQKEETTKFYYQCPPTLRLQPGPARAIVRAHHDAEYGHQNGELNFWMPLTTRCTKVDLWCESSQNADDFQPLPAEYGQVVSFHGSSCRHYVNANHTPHTRASLDFRVGVEGFFDPKWQMSGTTDDHTRRTVEL